MAAAVLVVFLTVGCGIGDQPPADRAKACEAMAAAVRPANLDGTPDEPTTTRVANAMDPLLSSLRDVAAHDAAVRLHQQLHRYASALKSSSDKTDDALTAARKAAQDLARACQLPDASLLSDTPPTPTTAPTTTPAPASS